MSYLGFNKLKIAVLVVVLVTAPFGTLRAADASHPQNTSPAEGPQSEPPDATEKATDASEEAIVPATGDPEERLDLNLLGQTDTDSGEGRRNENVQFNAVDNNALRELNTRLGTTATIVDFKPERGYFGAEFGNPPTSPLHLPASTASGFHGNFYEAHTNSIFQARSFFQVGNVLPARENDYGFNVGLPLWEGGFFAVDASQQRARGNVNGNILVPRPDERTPLNDHPDTRTNDPATRALVQRILDAYPREAPNRTDIDPRALNTNAPQAINTDTIGSQFTQDLSPRDRLFLQHRLTSQRVDAFQLVQGQNPNTMIRSHRARIGWNRTWTPATITDFTVGLDRAGSLLVPADGALPTDYSFSNIFERLGPGSDIPIDRAVNEFRYAGRVRHVRRQHNLTFGFDLQRRQFNSMETNSHRGVMSFQADFGRDGITNLRLGIPTRYSGAVGLNERGFRDWRLHYFAGDEWRVSSNFTLNVAIRYEPNAAPTEVNGLTDVGIGCDCNNVGGHFGLAYNLPGRLGVMRAAYGLHYAEVAPATYQQVRFNPPSTFKLVVANPDLVDPLRGLTIDDFNPNDRATIFVNAPGLVAPYSHQYNFSWEPSLSNRIQLQLGYLGSRSQKLFFRWYTNRAQAVDDLSQMTTATINDRRPDEEHFDIRKIINASRGYFDAARATLIMPNWNGLSVDTSYWFSKAIDLGAGYTNTGTFVANQTSRNQSEFLLHEDLRGISDFHQTHAFLSRITYVTPAPTTWHPWFRHAFGEWNLSAVALLKSGTPFTIEAGSDSPGLGNVDGDSGDRVHIIEPTILGRTIDNPDTSAARLPFSAFAFMSIGEARGNIGRNTFSKDGVNNINASLSRTWRISAEKAFMFRAESINFFNSPQFASPGSTLSSPNFGRITNTLNEGRTFRFLLRFAF
ncbi:MAG: hypothetical protein O2968_15870 [Acidobacteria bacterium]|nr:hypothetical protein [Acidobacteriota bacterium]